MYAQRRLHLGPGHTQGELASRRELPVGENGGLILGNVVIFSCVENLEKCLGSFARAILTASSVALPRVCFELLVHDYGAIVRLGETYVVW
jgi:hypothetical protein